MEVLSSPEKRSSFQLSSSCRVRSALEALTQLSEVLPSAETEKEILQSLHIFANGDFKTRPWIF